MTELSFYKCSPVLVGFLSSFLVPLKASSKWISPLRCSSLIKKSLISFVFFSRYLIRNNNNNNNNNNNDKNNDDDDNDDDDDNNKIIIITIIIIIILIIRKILSSI